MSRSSGCGLLVACSCCGSRVGVRSRPLIPGPTPAEVGAVARHEQGERVAQHDLGVQADSLARAGAAASGVKSDTSDPRLSRLVT